MPDYMHRGFKWTVYFLLFFSGSCKKEPVNPADETGYRDTTLVNVAYGSHPRQVYDIHLPANRDSTTPFIVVIHGGAWRAGQKEDMNGLVQLIKQKWNSVAVVNMNYRLASNANNIHHYELMDDIASAIGDVLVKRGSYGIGQEAGIMGASAGGQLAMIYAYSYNDHGNIRCVGSLFGPALIKDWSWYNSFNIWLGSNVGDILTEYVGQPWDTTVYASVSPYFEVSSGSPPTILFHGNLDPIVPVYQSQWMHNRLDSLGLVNAYHEYVAFHGFDAAQSDDVMEKLVAFFRSRL